MKEFPGNMHQLIVEHKHDVFRFGLFYLFFDTQRKQLIAKNLPHLPQFDQHVPGEASLAVHIV